MGREETDICPEPTVSVVIPTHQRRQLVLRALRSVFSQTLRPTQVIVVDDGSTDGTAVAVRAEFPTAELIEQTNRGVSAARNAGIRRAEGDWVAFLDSDDEWKPEKLERQLEALRAAPQCRICHCDEIWIRRGNQVLQRRVHRKRGGWIYQHCLPRCAISPSAAVVQRSLFDEIGLFDEDLPACEDYDLWLRACAHTEVAFVERPLVVKHGGHDDQLSRTVPQLDRFRLVALAKALDQLELSLEQRTATVAMLRHKLEVYLGGARRRGRVAEVAEVEARYAPYLARDVRGEQAMAR